VVLWRISRHLDLSGIGGLGLSGRWHDKGQPVVYLSENAASTLLEVCVHTAANDVPPEFTLLRVEGPDVNIRTIGLAELPVDWRTRPDITRAIGTRWLRSNEGVLLRIPSAIVPRTANFLFNPLHLDAKGFRIAEVLKYPFDVRIKE
jgi:RES domain-containing protein